jgi:hypothetical protein
LVDAMLNAIFAAALFASQPPISGEPRFDDPAIRGMPFYTEQPRIARAYRGTWADRAENCYAVADRGRQVEIGLHAIGRHAVRRTSMFSDYPAMIVEVAGDYGETVTVHLDLSEDGNFLKIADSGKDADVMVRCPPPPEVADLSWTGPAGWTEQARAACKARDFDSFFEAYLASQPVQWAHRARRVKIVDGSGSRQVDGQSLDLPPLMMTEYGRYVMRGEGPDESFDPVAITLAPAGRGRWRVEWSRAKFLEDGSVDYRFGPAGWMRFDRRKGCWQLTEQGMVGGDAAQ